MAAQEIQLIGQGILLRGAGLGVQVVDGVFPQLPAATALAAARRARAGGAMLSAVPACTSSGQETRAANLIGRLNATPSAVRAHTSLRQLGPAIGA